MSTKKCFELPKDHSSKKNIVDDEIVTEDPIKKIREQIKEDKKKKKEQKFVKHNPFVAAALREASINMQRAMDVYDNTLAGEVSKRRRAPRKNTKISSNILKEDETTKTQKKTESQEEIRETKNSEPVKDVGSVKDVREIDGNKNESNKRTEGTKGTRTQDKSERLGVGLPDFRAKWF